MTKKKNNVKALKSYFAHGPTAIVLPMSELREMVKEDREGYAELCRLAEIECKELGLAC